MATRLENDGRIAPADAQFDDEPSSANLDSSASNRRRRRRSADYAWKFWKFDWGTPGSGEHKIRSRAFDVDGNVQPVPEDPFLASKRTFWEDNGQVTRRVSIH